MHYLLSAVNQDEIPSDEVVRLRLEQGFWGLERTARFLADFRPGDRCCFYAAGVGVVGMATVVSPPQPEIHPTARAFGRYDASRFRLDLSETKLIRPPIRLTPELRASLDAFRGRNPNGVWGWFVQTTSRISARDFGRLTGEP